ncbi:TPA: hypothetical protein HA235_01230 [Candidatus Woesearchaeota archaeon]|nr:DegT/DnrJ/EryC1/StrS family aminotransferase [Candidatus Woesearchaeota archaeon]HIH31306.1 hypothetical protein [Candidatus Woesearchaeota archaeon]HIH55403.1 hypothetical protein [Candidatus Woesearchaeota archaeon]HIJ01595.1 hypothetical protein [Candidatus Woesearchaeota archaeon]HIJ14594.1 hypothetical protein [Candidatus Woesearchaeota archaeon]
MKIEPYQKDALIKYINQEGSCSSPSCEGAIATFEKSIAEYFKRKYVLLTVNGTSALMLAYLSTGVSRNTPVIVPQYAHYAAIHPLKNITDKIIPIPVDSETLEMNIELVGKAFKKLHNAPKPALLNVVMTGFCTNSTNLRKLCDTYDAIYIEDCSRAYLCNDDGILGTKGDVSCFSMQGSKALCAGEGGLFLTDNQSNYEHAVQLAFPGRTKHTGTINENTFESSIYPFKLRPSPIIAVIAHSQLPYLEERVNNSRKNLKLLADALEENMDLNVIHKESIHKKGGWKDACIKCQDAEYATHFVSILKNIGVQARLEFSDAFVDIDDYSIYSNLVLLEGFSGYKKADENHINQINKIATAAKMLKGK